MESLAYNDDSPNTKVVLRAFSYTPIAKAYLLIQLPSRDGEVLYL